MTKLNLPSVHPGRTLAAELKSRGLSARFLSRAIYVTSNRINEIANGKRKITADTALRLARFFGTSAMFWMTLQSNYDLAIAKKKHGAAINRKVKPLC